LVSPLKKIFYKGKSYITTREFAEDWEKAELAVRKIRNLEKKSKQSPLTKIPTKVPTYTPTPKPIIQKPTSNTQWIAPSPRIKGNIYVLVKEVTDGNGHEYRWNEEGRGGLKFRHQGEDIRFKYRILGPEEPKNQN